MHETTFCAGAKGLFFKKRPNFKLTRKKSAFALISLLFTFQPDKQSNLPGSGFLQMLWDWLNKDAVELWILDLKRDYINL